MTSSSRSASRSARSLSRRDRQWTRLLLIVLVTASVVLGVEAGALPVRVPATLADQHPVQVEPLAPGFPIDYLGVVWDAPGPSTQEGPDHPVDEPYGAVRFHDNGAWGPWISLAAGDVQAPGHWNSSLVAGGDADAYQVRGLPRGAASPRVVALNTTDGPLVTVGYRPSGALAEPVCISRSEWGADESLRYVDGVESWPVTFEPVRAMTVHHTATANDDPLPAGTVRAIYYYHTVTNGWGDIAYQYLIDEQGWIYEGRWSGETSGNCTEFAHDETTGELVTAGHTYCYNRGNLGVALLGDFTTVVPTADARAALEALLADNAERHGLDPLEVIFFEAPNDMEACVDTVDATIETIAAHTDWPDPAGATACPGASFYPQLPGVRVDVALLMGMEVPPITVGAVEYQTDSSRRRVKSLSVTVLLEPPVQGATVSATLTGPSSASQTSPTDDDGSITITIRRPKEGCYTTDVTAVQAPGHLRDGVTPENEFCL